MPVQDLGDWLDEQRAGEPGVLWYVKRLSANDTQATGGHQAGPYIPKQFLFTVIPSLNRPAAENPKVPFEVRLGSHPDVRTVTATWYNKGLRGGKVNETRLTGFGGASSSPLLDPVLTGALAVFAFRPETPTAPLVCHAWVCEHETEADLIEELVGPVEPGQGRVWPDLFGPLTQSRSCWLEPDEIPPAWLDRYPTGEEMIRKVLELRPASGDVDSRLVRRRECEEQLFYSIEDAIEFPRLRERFDEFRTFGEFMDFMQPSAQRRRSRSGNSLQLHVRNIFEEEGLEEGRHFSYQATTEGSRRPDFLFPSAEAYHDTTFPDDKLRMLGVKTSLRERWTEVLTEALRVKTKHLLTLDTVTEGQLGEMERAGLHLVVPRSLHSKSRPPVRPYLQTVESFLADIRLLAP